MVTKEEVGRRINKEFGISKQITICKVDKQQDPTVEYRKLYTYIVDYIVELIIYIVELIICSQLCIIYNYIYC